MVMVPVEVSVPMFVGAFPDVLIFAAPVAVNPPVEVRRPSMVSLSRAVAVEIVAVELFLEKNPIS